MTVHRISAPAPSARLYRMLTAVEAERGAVIPFPESRPIPEPRTLPAPADGMRRDDPVPDRRVMPPVVPAKVAGSSHTLPAQVGPFPHPPHVGPFQRRQPGLHVLIEAPQPQPLDPAKLAAIEWARRHRDGWDTFGVVLAITATVLIAARCAPAIFPSLFG